MMFSRISPAVARRQARWFSAFMDSCKFSSRVSPNGYYCVHLVDNTNRQRQDRGVDI